VHSRKFNSSWSVLQTVRKEAPRMGGSFANWGLAFSCFDCSLQYIRKKVICACLRTCVDEVCAAVIRGPMGGP
jgi:hypothetical protein